MIVKEYFNQIENDISKYEDIRRKVFFHIR